VQHKPKWSENGPETMPRRYTAEERAEALRSLDLYQGSIQLTSLRTGIPERTLRDWRKQRSLSDPVDNNHQEDLSLPPEKKSSAAAIKELQDLRELLMSHVFEIAASLSQNDELVNMRAIAVSRLLDRVMKLDIQIAQIIPDGPQVFRVEYQYPDGTIHDMPIWRNPVYLPWDHPDFDPKTGKSRNSAE
jgi:transposase-like protein